MRTLLALDVATVTGWAFGSIADGRPTLAGSLRFGEKGAGDPRVWAKALQWLNDTLSVHQPDMVAIEAPITSASPAGGSNAHTMGRLIGLQAVLRTVVELRMPVSAKLIHVQSARKLFIGVGNLGGAQAKAAVQARCIELGWVEPGSVDPDKCDAMCVWAKAATDFDPAFAATFHQPKKRRAIAPADIEF